MILAWLLLLTGLTISAVAIYYSVVGLAAIFSAAVIPIIVMGSALEVAKLVCASWLKANWDRAPRLMKIYMTTAVVVLMIITSMGIFGFLSKAHSDQSLVSGDVQSRLMLIDEKIKIERENIANSQQVIKQMDAAVNGVISTGDQEVKLKDGSTQVRSAAERSLQIRRSQAKDRAKLTKEIEDAQSRIIKLQEESAPIRAENRKVEAEVGPLKYIAKFIYGDNPDTNILEKAVTWVILIIIVVFDPLAVIMLLGAQMTFQWHNKGRDLLSDETTPDPYVADVGEKPTKEELDEVEKIEPVISKQFIDNGEHPKDNFGYEEQTHTEEVPANEPLTATGGDITATEEQQVPLTSISDVEQWNKMIEEAEKAVEEEKNIQTEDSKKKTYVTKDQSGHQQIKNRS